MASDVLKKLAKTRAMFEQMNAKQPTEDDIDELIGTFGEDVVSDMLSCGKMECKGRTKEQKQVEFLAAALVRAQIELDTLRQKQAIEKQNEGVNGLLAMLFNNGEQELGQTLTENVFGTKRGK